MRDWPERLAAFIEQRRETPFAWGGHDCALFACDGWLAMTGSDPAAAYRGVYDTEAEADAIIREAGSLEMLLDRVLVAFGGHEVQPAFARRGDIVVVRVGNEHAAGLCIGAHCAVPGVERLRFVRLSAITKAWTI